MEEAVNMCSRSFEVALKRQVLDQLLADDKWRKRLEKAGTAKQMEQVLVEFYKEKGFKVAELK